MSADLSSLYIERLSDLFRRTKKSFAHAEFGGKTKIINATQPIIILEHWRENGHQELIPLLDEVVRNTILGTAAAVMGWEKTCNLHLRVALEGLVLGATLFLNARKKVTWEKGGEMDYVSFANLLSQLKTSSLDIRRVERKIKFLKDVKELFSELSKWSHTLGQPFQADLKVLGGGDLTPPGVGRLIKNFRLFSRFACLTYSAIYPELFSSLNRTQQSQFLAELTGPERNILREILDV